MNFFKPPTTNYVDHYDQSKFNLVWSLCIALIILLSLITGINFSNDNYSTVPNLIAIGIAIGALIVLRTTKEYKPVSLFASIGCLILISFTFFLLEDILHYTTPMWMLINILFTFFILGKRWGIGILISHFIVLAFYFHYRLEDNIYGLKPFDDLDVWNFIFETSIIALGIAYLLLQFIQTNKYAENQLKKTNEVLLEQNQLVSFQNEEMEIMLKEIHHRVKNNLQVITSLLRLQSYEIEDEAQSKAFTDAINRIKSMALIHEKMYQSSTLSNFNIEDYLKSLATELIKTYVVLTPIELDVKSEIPSIGTKSIVPVSLLFNELISNSLKH
ncbi:MAG: hypothetical protein JKY09_05905, partial [Crocinitomicaceae bacterium]|nr:hypothetical protein [Crocinitomicaceae bacterium]